MAENHSPRSLHLKGDWLVEAGFGTVTFATIMLKVKVWLKTFPGNTERDRKYSGD